MKRISCYPFSTNGWSPSATEEQSSIYPEFWMYGPRLVPEINSPRRSALKKATCSLYTGGKLEVKITILDCIPSCQTLFQLPVGFGPYAVLVTAYNPQLHPPSQAIGCRNKAGGFAVNKLEYTFGAGEKPLLSRLGHYR